MFLPKLVCSSQLTVHSKNSSVNREPTTVNKPRWRHGFTLIELLVVISIIAVLVGVASVSYTNAQKKARDNRRKSDLKSIQQALELYFQANKYYPPLDSAYPTWCTKIISSNPFEQLVQQALEPTYIQKIPQDPLYANQINDYVYKKISKTEYELYSELENTNDPEKGTYTPPNCSWITWTYYKYKVTNP